MRGFWSGGDIRDALTRERLVLPSPPECEARPSELPPLIKYGMPGGKRPAALIAKALRRLKGAP